MARIYNGRVAQFFAIQHLIANTSPAYTAQGVAAQQKVFRTFCMESPRLDLIPTRDAVGELVFIVLPI